MFDMLIRNGSAVFETETRSADIPVKDGKIAAILETGE